MKARDSWPQGQYRPTRRSILRGGVGLAAGSTAAVLLACGGESKKEAAFRSEQLHVWRGAPAFSTIDPLRKRMGSKIVVDEWPSLGMWTLALNGTRAPWNDVRVREAIYRVTSRQQYLDLLSDGKGVVTPGTLSAGLTDYLVDAKQTEKYWKQDPKAAKQLLDAAAFPCQLSAVRGRGFEPDSQVCDMTRQLGEGEASLAPGG